MFKTRLLPRLFLAALFLAPLATAPSAHAQTMTPANEMPAGEYVLDKTHASLIWQVSHAGLINYTARFTDFTASLDFDPKDPTKSELTASVNPLSVQTDYVVGERDFNKELATDDKWFNGKKFPSITFKSTSIKKTGENTAEIHGDLTFLGVTKPLVLNATFNGAYAQQPFSKKPTMGFSATGKLSRSEWGLDTYTPIIGDVVTLQIEAEMAQAVKEAAAK